MKKRGLLLLNMGGINSIDEVELFLYNMFNDKNILPINRYFRKFIAYTIINSRADEVKENYKKYLGGKSPLSDITYELIDKLREKLDMPIAPAMRYTPPFATPALKDFKQQGIKELILFPMYPQYSTTTTLSSIEDIKLKLKELNYNANIKVVKPYYDNYEYIELIYYKIKEALENRDAKKYDLILSAHSLPIKIIKNGDVYEKQIEANLSALKIMLHLKGLFFKNIKLAYQSKVGKSRWLEPNLIDVLKNSTNKKVLIYPLSFTIDNSETIFELSIEHKAIAQKLDYSDYIVAKCLNSDNRFVDFIIKEVSKIV